MYKWCLLLVLALAVPATAGNVSDNRRLLLIDDSVQRLSLSPSQQVFETRDVRPANGYGWESGLPSKGAQIAKSAAYTIGLGAMGGVFAAAHQVAAIEKARQQWLAPLLKEIGPEPALQTRFLDTLRSALADAGMPVDRVVISPKASSAVLPRAIRDERAALVIRPRKESMLTLTASDRRVVIDLLIEGYERPGERFRKRTDHAPMRYVSAPMEGADAGLAWAHAEAGPFWGEVERGLQAVVAATGHAVPGDVGKEERVVLDHPAPGEEFRGRLIRREGELAFIAESDGGLMIVRDRAALNGSSSNVP